MYHIPEESANDDDPFEYNFLDTAANGDDGYGKSNENHNGSCRVNPVWVQAFNHTINGHGQGGFEHDSVDANGKDGVGKLADNNVENRNVEKGNLWQEYNADDGFFGDGNQGNSP